MAPPKKKIDRGLIGLKVEAVAVDANSSPVVVLREIEGARVVPIWVGPAEAVSISLAMQGPSLPRPMTHDLMRILLEELKTKLIRLVISDMRDGTYFGTLVLHVDSQERQVDCRPSDGIALALRMKAPIVIPGPLLERIHQERQQIEAEQIGETLKTGGVTLH